VIAECHRVGPLARAEAWEVVAAQQKQIKAWLDQGVTLTKVHTLRGRRSVVVSYRTLYRYATTELGLGSGRRRCVEWPLVD